MAQHSHQHRHRGQLKHRDPSNLSVDALVNTSNNRDLRLKRDPKHQPNPSTPAAEQPPPPPPPAEPAGTMFTSVVFVTQSPTFSGTIAAYTTLAFIGQLLTVSEVTSEH